MAKVCCLPETSRFGPLNLHSETANNIFITVDEYEAIRLIDMEGLTQEECSGLMNISRTTVQGIYNNARKKLAESLVNGKVLNIAGGEYKLCDGHEIICGFKACRRHMCKRGCTEDEK